MARAAQRSSIEQKTRQVAAAAAGRRRPTWRAIIDKRAKAWRAAEAVTGEGDLVADVAAGRQKLSALKDDESARHVPPA